MNEDVSIEQLLNAYCSFKTSRETDLNKGCNKSNDRAPKNYLNRKVAYSAMKKSISDASSSLSTCSELKAKFKKQIGVKSTNFSNSQSVIDLCLNESEGENFLEEAENEYNVACISCSWFFPKELSEEEMNAHVNQCLDGRGQENKSNHLLNLNLIKRVTMNQ